MFFTGDASTRKRVDLGGRSSKERDRDKVLEQARRERNRRMELRRENASALKIQKCFRGRRATALARSKVRELFFNTYGHCCENMDRYSLHPDSEFLRQLVFFFNANNRGDCDVLVGACRKLLLYVNQNADFLSMLAGMDNSLKHTITYYRLKRFTYFCLQAVHQYRDQFKEKLLVAEEYPSAPTTILLEAVAILINPELPWVCNIVDYLANKNAYLLLQDIILSGMSSMKISESPGTVPPLEHVIILIASHTGHNTCSCTNRSPLWNFPSEILSVPFIWKSFPYLKEMFSTEQLGRHHIQQMAQHLYNRTIVLPDDTSPEFPGSICLLGNLLETATVTLSQPLCSHDVAVDFAAVASYLLETVPPLEGSNTDNYAQNENEMICDEENREILNLDLQNQIVNSIDSLFLETMVNSLFRDTSLLGYSSNKGLTDEELSATGAICYFLHVAFLVLPLEGIMTALAYRTEIVVILWNFIKWCHENRQWPSFSRLSVCLPRDAPGWLLPLAVFCPIYKHMLMIIDNEEFYEQQKPLSLKDIKCLVFILKLALWELIWVIPGNAPSFYKPSFKFPTCNKLSIDDVKYRVRIVTSELLNQLQDRNSRRAFMSPNDFHAPEAVGDAFISQALTENSRANDVLKHASFLVPFTSRVKIFMSQLTAARQRDSHHPAFTRYRFKIRRNQIFEDAFAQLSTLSEEQLRGTVRISFINELGEEEAGIDGGGLFKDFIESICRESFDVQYGLFKETNNHLLYPNPGSGLIHEQHLQFFHFLGTVLGKAMFEGILVDIPFATFFLSKLKQKHNYFNDLPSLDPELYRHLLFLKHYKGDVSELELYFVIVNNDYGEQTEEELVPGGKNKRVTKENVIMFIHLVANYRLNFQIRLQSIHFLRGFQQLIQKEWLDLFNEHEIQLLISGSSDGMDIADLRSHAQYSGGYHQDHPVILMFWEVIKSFSKEHQMKILKFVTGCSRGPLLGFKYLEPKFCIQRAAPADVTEEDLDRLPTSATCMNLLKLPPYRSKEQLRDKLMYAINAEAGFDLS